MFTFQRRNKAQRKHQKASAKRSRSKPAARSRLFLEPLEDRTLLSGNPYTDFINIFDANLNGQATNLQTTLGNGFLPVENSLSNINDIPFLQGQNLFSQLKNAVIASSQFFSDFKNTLKSIQL